MAASRKVRFVLVSRKTRLQELTERFNTWPQAKFYLEHAHVDAEDYLREHDVYWAPLEKDPRYRALMAKVKADVDRQAAEIARIDAAEDFVAIFNAAMVARKVAGT